MPKEAKPRKDPRRASRGARDSRAKDAARDASRRGDGNVSRGAGESGRGFRRWTSTVIWLLAIQALAVLSLWRSGDRLPPSAAGGGGGEAAAPRGNGQVFLGKPPLAVPPPAPPAPVGPEFTGPDAAEEGDIAVLLIASGRSVSSLQQTLKSLLRGFSASSILVSQAAPGEASREATAELGVAWVGPSPMADFATFDGEAEPWLHYGRSLEHAATKHFAGQTFRSLFVAEEDLIFSSGLFSFLAQLHPLLFEDDSLWCISAWNDYSLAPFAQDVSSVLRSAWFSGRAWLVTLRRIREELLPNWSLQQRWRPLLRQWAAAASKECLLPEVSRVAFTNYQCDGVGIRGQCDEEEVDARRRAASAIFAPARRAKLGEVRRLTKEKYVTLLGSSWPRNGGLQKAVAVTSVKQLYEDTSTPLLVVIDDQKDPTGAAWESVLDYFGLPAAPDRGPRNSFRGVVRLRWRETVLYLASSSSPLRSEYFPSPAMPISPKEFQLLPGSGVHRTTGLLPPAFLAPWSRPSVADVGVSCLLHCASRGEVCVDADLAYVGKCAPPLTDLLRCFSCIDKAESSVFPGFFPGLQMRSETCFGAAALPNLPSSRHSKCSAQDDGVQRLCVCRSHSQATDLQSASSQFLLRQKEPQRSRASSATKERRSRPNLQRFGELLQAGSIPNSVLTPLDLSILLIAPDAASESLLQRTLSSLSETQGFVASTVLLAHSQPKLFIAQLAEHFQVQRLQVDIDQRIKRDSDRLSALYKAAFEGFQKTNLPKVRFVLVLTYGDLLAPDALWYFSQLADVLQRDDSLLAANGWNDQALAPYAADPTVVLRTDWFSGSGWLATHEVMQEMLSQWHLGRPWDAMFRDERLRKKRQFLTPEVSRVIPDSGWVLDLDNGPTGRHNAARSRLDPHLFAQNPLCDVPVVDLGGLERLMEEPYKRLFFIDWPGEGLLKTKLLSSLQSLLEGKINSGGPFRLVYRNLDPESDTTWKGVAQFFNLWPELPMRGAYYGIVRLRWRDTVLYLVPSSSPLCRGEVREALLRPEEDAVTGSVLPPTASQILDPMLFPLASHPLLVPASSELLAADFPGTSCSFVCEEAGLRCHPEDLAFINNCAALASLGCRHCEVDEGPDQPAQELQGPKAGRCLYNGNLGRYPLSCDASHLGTRRLCICREPIRLAAAAAPRKVISSSPPGRASLNGLNGTGTVQVVLPASLRDLKPQDLAVLVVAGGQRPRMLERCLQALSKAYGYNKNMIMVSQDGDGTQTKIMAQKFHVGWRQVDTGVKSAGEKEALHYKMALQHAIEGPFKDKSALIILEEDMVVSFDILLYFAQFQEILKWDDIFSVSAWNENAIGPFSANAQHLLRVDSFSGAAWMVSTELMSRQLLPAWPRNFWQKHLRKVGAGKQNIIPELPRVRLDRTNLQSASILVSSARDLNHADLGDLRRLAAEVYLERLTTDLREATLVEELKNLPSPIKLRDSTLKLNWRVHYQSSQPDSDGTWNFLARYLQLPESGQAPLLDGVSKLVWGRGFLFLVASSSSLIVKARLRPLPVEAVAPEAFQEAARPLLLAPNGELLAADRTGQSCSDFCTSRGGFCAASDLLFANSCEAMRTVLFCERCERNMGSDQPAVASSRSSRSYGACLYNGDILHHPITCEAAHRETRRLCVCRDVAGVPSTTTDELTSESSSKSKHSLLETREPTTESSSTLPAEAAETTQKQSKEPTTESSSTLPAEAAETTRKQSKEKKSSADMVSSADVVADVETDSKTDGATSQLAAAKRDAATFAKMTLGSDADATVNRSQMPT